MADPVGTFKKPNKQGYMPAPLPREKAVARAKTEVRQFLNHFQQRRRGYVPFIHESEDRIIIGVINWAAGVYIWWETTGMWRGKELARSRMEWATRAHGVDVYIGSGPVSREQLQAGQKAL